MASFGDDVWDLATGRKRSLYDGSDAEGDCPQPPDADERFPVRYVVSPSGIVAGLYRPNACGKATDAQILASVPGQAGRVVLDSGAIRDLPAAGLSISGRTVTWTKAGVTQSRTL
jgi:hypothetical protein